ncbi:hypothetical protein BAUCODRAFT_38002 [Baudoinia panamericana UAMH 10762]|uniref:Brix domain-containing protein n=1 Tax=Baudoinia panamericana (strain UAMH 10762) TaxID=717646 RepID=M2M9K1_BAUPA|nr:uncharacterized protein BAUCODRAFT_38002 [Baudoinia panamericana UAMH 10762]EMC93091.1 hypothetical protein BAUCODRAFT_38002 [Baudoinia panamericana UAMH 10762]
MAKRRIKRRTHTGAPGRPSAPASTTGRNAPSKPGSRDPKSMVIRVGANDVGPSISQLVHDVRSMLEPSTASRLKERRSNKLRDYTTMAGPLGVTHLLLFSRSGSGNVNMRLALTPRGPTLHWRVEGYSLCKDLYKSMKRPMSGANEVHLTAPLLVMNNFSSHSKDGAEGGQEKAKAKAIPKHLENLTTTIFQSLFPPINPATMPLTRIKRVLLLDRVNSPSPSTTDSDSDSASYILNLRHYTITTRPTKSLPKALRRLDPSSHPSKHHGRNGIPNLGKLNDVADYLLDPHAADGFTSGSESEAETDAEVEVQTLTQKPRQRHPAKSSDKPDRRNGSGPRVEKKAIKLHELGPRLRLRLTKVEEGVCGGKVMWHEYIHKSAEEVREMEKVHERRRQEREARKAEQRANVERKRAERRASGKAGEGEEDGEEEDDFDEDEDDDVWHDEDEDMDGMEDVEPGAEDEDEEMNGDE